MTLTASLQVARTCGNCFVVAILLRFLLLPRLPIVLDEDDESLHPASLTGVIPFATRVIHT